MAPIPQTMLYDLIYALAATDGRETVLFGNSAPAAREAFAHSVPAAFPELWFELPLAGEPWFDLHALTSRSDLQSGMTLDAATTGGYPEVFAWFAAQDDVRQLALSWDTGSGRATSPAVQLLVSGRSPHVTCAFLQSAHRSDASPAYRAFYDHLPKGWFPCYAGVFPQRPEHNLRVECIPDTALQRAYAHNAQLLEAHLRHVGLSALDDALLERCQALACTPFRLEFQFDVDAQGQAGATFGASLRFAQPPGVGSWQAFASQTADALMTQLESWGLVDERWHLLADTTFAKRASKDGRDALLYSYPAFVKLRWRDGEPLDAKAYLMAGVQ